LEQSGTLDFVNGTSIDASGEFEKMESNNQLIIFWNKRKHIKTVIGDDRVDTVSYQVPVQFPNKKPTQQDMQVLESIVNRDVPGTMKSELKNIWYDIGSTSWSFEVNISYHVGF
jgi:hypothetical protein